MPRNPDPASSPLARLALDIARSRTPSTCRINTAKGDFLIDAGGVPLDRSVIPPFYRDVSRFLPSVNAFTSGEADICDVWLIMPDGTCLHPASLGATP